MRVWQYKTFRLCNNFYPHLKGWEELKYIQNEFSILRRRLIDEDLHTFFAPYCDFQMCFLIATWWNKIAWIDTLYYKCQETLIYSKSLITGNHKYCYLCNSMIFLMVPVTLITRKNSMRAIFSGKPQYYQIDIFHDNQRIAVIIGVTYGFISIGFCLPPLSKW